MNDFSVYVHIPFCERRCGYCDFNTYAGIMHLMDGYVDAVCAEVLALKKSAGDTHLGQIATIYFGGGTPSLLPPPLIEKLLTHIKMLGDFLEGGEVTLEVNPGTITEEYFQAVLESGINRLSIGVQSTHKQELEILDRMHGFPEAVKAVEAARKSGFRNISLDFIYGLPHQRIEDWEVSLLSALTLEPEHLSLYALSVEPGTPLEQKVLAGIYPMPEEDLAADMYELARSILDSAGYSHYEISNWAKEAETGEVLVSKHNRQYWKNLPYLGLGAGAHGFIGGYRTINESLPYRFIKCFQNGDEKQFPQTPATVDLIAIDKNREMQETMMMGLRLLEEGVSEAYFEGRFDEKLSDVFGKEIALLLNKGLVMWEKAEEGDRCIKITAFGYLLANQVFQEFV